MAFEHRSGIGSEDLLNALGAGDQGMMFGYACDDNEDFMPLPIWLAHRLSMRLAQVRRSGQCRYLRPDGKTQVTIAYEDGQPVAIDTVLISTQHDDNFDSESEIKPDLLEHVIRPMLPADLDTSSMKVYVNPSGKFVLGGPHADTGLTGRKIIVDTYGGMARHGGGAFSGKDPTKVDRSAAYAARWVAKHVVASGAARALRGAGGLRDRGRASRVGAGRDLRHRSGRPSQDRQGRRRHLRPATGRHHSRPRPAPTDLPAHRRLRPLRAQRPGLHLGADAPPRRSAPGTVAV